MSTRRHLADLRIYIRQGDELFRALSVTASRTGNTRDGAFELYVSRHLAPLQGRSSIHASGLMISRNEIINVEDRHWRRPIAEVGHLTYLDGITVGSMSMLNLTSQASAGTSEKRLAAEIVWPEHPHGYVVWAVPQPAAESIRRLAGTPPYPDSRIVATLAADWLSPAIVVTVWEGTTERPYKVGRFTHKLTGQVRHLVEPRAYEGTWIDDEAKFPQPDAETKTMLDVLRATPFEDQ